jgi:arylsulfatase A-like enzyme
MTDLSPRRPLLVAVTGIWIAGLAALVFALVAAEGFPFLAMRLTVPGLGRVPRGPLVLGGLWLASGLWLVAGALVVSWLWTPRQKWLLLMSVPLSATLWITVSALALVYGSPLPKSERLATPHTHGPDLLVEGVSTSPTERPNVLLVVSDTLRRNNLGLYGYHRDTSAALDAFAADALVFDHAYAQSPSTKPAIASLFTSRFPTQHGAIGNRDSISPAFVTLAEALRENGYATGAFVENPIIGEQFRYDQGFDMWLLDSRRHLPEDPDAVMDELDNEIHAWLRSKWHEPFFLYVHYIDPHSPYRAPPGFRGYYADAASSTSTHWRVGTRAPAEIQEVIDQYDEEIRYTDQRFGVLIDEIRDEGLLEETIVVFLSDHGEGFGERGLGHHSYGVYSELIDVPLLIRYPKALTPGRSSVPVQHVDVFPTILDLARIDSEPYALHGQSILTALQSGSPSEGREILSEHLRAMTQRALVKGRWKLVHTQDWGIYELFDIREDPGERHNLLRPWGFVATQWSRRRPDDWLTRQIVRASSRVRTADQLMQAMQERLEQLGEEVAAEQVELDPETTKALRSLGYIE